MPWSARAGGRDPRRLLGHSGSCIWAASVRLQESNTLILPILIGIAVLALAIFGVILFLKARGSPIVERRFPRRIQLAILSATTIVLVALWLIFDLFPAMLHALIVVQWIPLLSRQEPGIPKSRLILILVTGFTVLLMLGTTVFRAARN